MFDILVWQDNQLVVWSHNTTNDTSITASVADTSTSSFESNESGVDSESTPAVEQPYYVMTSSSQWGIYPSVPPCPPPQVPYAYGPPAVHVPTPVYVTFSDGTTMVVPSHRTADNQQGLCWHWFFVSSPYCLTVLLLSV